MFKTMHLQGLICYGNRQFLRQLSVKINDIVIASAVRTPVHAGLRDLPKEQLLTLVLEEAIKRGAMPKNEVHTVYLTTAVGEVLATEGSAFLKGAAYTTVQDEVQALQLAIEELQLGKTNAAIVGGTSLQSNCENFNDNSQDRFAEAVAKGVFDAELIPVSLRSKRAPLVIIERDECFTKQREDIHSAIALVLTNSYTAKRLALEPLARIAGYHSAGDAATTVGGLLGNACIKPDHIGMWEMQQAITLSSVQHLKIDAKCNKYGVESTFNSPLQLLTHLTHALPMGQLGCVVLSGSAAFLLEKLSNSTKSIIPLLTLYTKEDCDLCDILVDELQAEFPGQYQLEKVFITAKENVRFLRLFRYDIPVLFLNRQFLCMHRLNVNLLRRKLKELSSSSI